MNERLLLFISSLQCGGAERVMVNNANHWAQQGRDVFLATFCGSDNDFYRVAPGVRRKSLHPFSSKPGLANPVLNVLSFVMQLRFLIRRIRPKVVVSFMTDANVIATVACATRVPVVICERTNPYMIPSTTRWGIPQSVFYKFCSALVVQTEGAREWATKLVGKQRVIVIPNSLSEMFEKCPNHTRKGRNEIGPILVTMGRLVSSKQFDHVIRAFAKVSPRVLGSKLWLIGDGPEIANLKALSQHLGIEDRVVFWGQVDDPIPILAQADLFVFTSQYEGFPNALLEAMSLGLPAISYDCPYGPSDIIRSGIDGILVPLGDLDQLTAEISGLLMNDMRRLSMASRAGEVRDRYSIHSINAMWDGVLEAVSRS
ncbi:MAG TPA: glycosyltransferase family 4 protein [Candidatus Ozemobacteraceae bacterium]|nr:glycosyltransferase family 4 protein [Candidatus Ozemobacteraceae bacterium]